MACGVVCFGRGAMAAYIGASGLWLGHFVALLFATRSVPESAVSDSSFSWQAQLLQGVEHEPWASSWDDHMRQLCKEAPIVCDESLGSNTPSRSRGDMHAHAWSPGRDSRGHVGRTRCIARCMLHTKLYACMICGRSCRSPERARVRSKLLGPNG